MHKINWKQKLSSRKFQMAFLIIIISGAILIFGEEVVKRVVAIAAMSATAVSYFFVESKCDIERIKRESMKLISELNNLPQESKNKVEE